jgi:hypothetical protein
MTDQRILDKIKKCLALSTSSEPAEAAAALRQAQKLMDAYNISMTDVSAASIGETRVKSKFSVSKVKPYELRVISTVAKAFNCELMWHSSKSYATDVFASFVIIGPKTQLELAEYTAEVMLRKLKAARTNFINSLPDYMNRAGKIQEADGFSMGWANAVSKVVNDFAGNEEIVKAIAAYKSKTYGNGLKNSAVQGRQLGAYGYKAGQEAGAGESIYRPMNETKTARLTAK